MKPLGEKISSPIIHIANIAEAVGKRNFKVKIRSKDELGTLGTSINKMIADLHNNTISISELNHEIKERKKVVLEQEKLLGKLQTALSEIRTLSGFLPICCSCKRIRDDKGYWNQIEAYILEHTEAELSHGICPECSKKLYPELSE